jgi:hypothetical protein
MRPSRELIASVNTSAFLVTNQKDEPITSGLLVIQDQPRTEHISEMGTSHQHGFVKRYGLVRDDRHEAPPVMVPFRRSPARPFAVLQIPRHHGWLRGKVDRILVVWILGAPRLNLLPRQVIFSVPDVHLHDAVTDRFPEMKWPRSLVHLTSVVEQANVRQDCAQTVVGLGLIVLQDQGSLELGDRFKVLEVFRRTP